MHDKLSRICMLLGNFRRTWQSEDLILGRWCWEKAPVFVNTLLNDKPALISCCMFCSYFPLRCCRCCKNYFCDVASRTAFNAKLNSQKQQSPGAHGVLRWLCMATSLLPGKEIWRHLGSLTASVVKTKQTCFLSERFAVFFQPFIPGNQTPISLSRCLRSSHS